MRILFALSLCCALSTQAQEIENVQVSLGAMEDGVKKYFITYDLIAPHANIACLVQVRFTSSLNSFYLKLVKGDVGNLVVPGKGKKIEWDFQEELVHFSGMAIPLDIEVSPNITVSSKVKRTKKLSVKLDDIYTKDKNYTFLLYRHEKEVAKLNEMPLSQSTVSIEIPAKIKVRGDYQLSITDGQHVFFSNTFKVKPKINNFWKILPVLLVPAFIIGKSYYEDQQDLPGVPDVPNN